MIKTYTVLSIDDLKRMIKVIRKAKGAGCKGHSCGVLYTDAFPKCERDGSPLYQAEYNPANFKA